MIARLAEALRWANNAASGLALDLVLYLGSAAFAGITAVTSALMPHRAWGQIACWGYAGSALVVGVQLCWRRLSGLAVRAWLTGLAWVAVALVPLIVQAIQRAAGQANRAQEEVYVIEQAAQRLIESGTPYLARTSIAALAEPLMGYLPYQPGMALFGVPRALVGVTWWTDARIWFALATIATLVGVVAVLHPASPPQPAVGQPTERVGGAALLRGVQAVTVLPICALTLATGGDDLPVLGLCLLALALAARHRWLAAGLAVGSAGALKLFAWPVAVVLAVTAVTRGRRPAVRFAAGGLSLPVLALMPAVMVGPGAVVENLLWFPLGRGLITSPAQSPLPGHLLATGVPGGRVIAIALLGAVALGFMVALIRRPPTTAAKAAYVSGLGLLSAILLLPSTRFGYLLYAVGFLFWAAALAGTTRASGVHLRHGSEVPGPRGSG